MPGSVPKRAISGPLSRLLLMLLVSGLSAPAFAASDTITITPGSERVTTTKKFLLLFSGGFIAPVSIAVKNQTFNIEFVRTK